MKKDTDYFVFNLMDALRAPILTHSSAWAEYIPERVLKIITQARLIALHNGEEMGTIPECAAFIMTASMEAPLDRDWTDIYTHVACQMCQDWFAEDHWDDVKAPRILTEYQRNYILNPLRKHIWKKRRKVLKQQMKEKPELKEKIMDQYQEALKVPAIVGQQLSLF